MSRYSVESIQERELFFSSDLHECFFKNKVYNFKSLCGSYCHHFEIDLKQIKKGGDKYTSLFIMLMTILPLRYRYDEIRTLLNIELKTLRSNTIIVSSIFHKDDKFRNEIIKFSEQYLTKSTRIKLIRLLK